MRLGEITRTTKETDIKVKINLDGEGRFDVETGIGFFNHMLEQLSKHSQIDMTIATKGDLHIDGHHTVEDTGIALGMAIKQALGDRAGITRYGDCHLPMDETMSRAAVDVSGRPFLVFRIPFSQARLGEMDTELFEEFFRAFAFAAGITLHVENLYGVNNHHMIESAFKAVARALRAACTMDPRLEGRVLSTKGTLNG